MSNKSEYLFNYFIDFLSILNKHKINNKLDDKIYHIFEMILYHNKLVKNLKIKKTNRKIIRGMNIPTTNLLKSSYISDNVISYFKEKSKSYSIVNCKIKNIDIKIYFLHFNKSKDIMNLDMVLTLLSLLLEYSKVELKTLKIYLYLSDINKMLPDEDGLLLNKNNCNSGISYSCGMEFLVYRKEEWFKVLIHEAFHGLCLDMASLDTNNFNHNINKLYNINIVFRPSEVYSEVWARILNCSFKSFKLLDIENEQITDIDELGELYFASFSRYYDLMIRLEKIFSIFQSVKILHYMKLKYSDFFNYKLKNDMKNKYRENTNVFAYYIITSILLLNSSDFLSWCSQNNGFNSLLNFNKNKNTIYSFFLMIYKYHKQQKYMKLNDYMLRKLNISLKQNDKNDKYYLQNTRMTIIEIN